MKNRPSGRFFTLYFLPAFQCAQKRDLVGIFQLAPDRDAVGQTRDLYAHRAKQTRQVHGRGLALGVRVRGHDDLTHRAVCDAVQQLADAQIVRPDVAQRRNDAVQHMVHAMVFPRPLHGDHILRLCHNADETVVALGVGADRAQLLIGQVLADRAEANAVLRVQNGPATAEKETVEIENLTAANKHITEVRRKISALGTPNLGAIDEYARVSERYEYLAAQRDDVQHAKSELENIVASITTEMTEIFVREFARIDEYFGKTFEEMFGGGKASLILEDKSAPLECGIEIRVQPPGKQVKTITLLSGGEKAFVAIALYFAILKVRPTPFCMLDEIDAALDDRNVERFANYLHTLSDKTQFIVITHRRGTMEAADVLYGVTMQEQGVSKILRLSLDELAKQLGVTN